MVGQPRRLPHALLAVLFLTHLGAVRAQQASFVWGFTTIESTLLPECGTVPVFVNTTFPSPGPTAVPPFYMIAYEAGGVATSSLMGSDPAALTWTVRHPTRARLLLNVVDANGNSGGVPPDIYTVQTGNGSACHASAPDPPVSLTIDLPTMSVTTCGILPMYVSGGTKPYTVSVAVADTATSTNYTMGAGDNYFEWVNREKSGSRFLATVSDAAGNYVKGTDFITTNGPADTSCPGLISHSGVKSPPSSSASASSSAPSASGSSPPSSERRSPSLGVIAGAAGGGALLILLGLALFFFLQRRRRNQRTGVDGIKADLIGPDARYSYSALPPQADTITPFTVPAASAGAIGAYAHDPYSDRTDDAPSRRTSTLTYGGGAGAGAGAGYGYGTKPGRTSQYGPPSGYRPPSSYGAPASNADSASQYPPSTYPPSSYAPTVRPPQSSTSGSPPPPANAPLPAAVPAWSEKRPRPPSSPPERVIQHEDGGAVIELPPAYRPSYNEEAGPSASAAPAPAPAPAPPPPAPAAP